MGFMDELNQIIVSDYQYTYTENGAKVYSSTGNDLLDLNYAVSSMRNMSADEIICKFVKALMYDERLAIKWLFYAGDVRGGLGERRLFKICLWYLAETRPETVKKLLPLVAEYTRYDNLFVLLDGALSDDVCRLIEKRLDADEKAMLDGKPVSLLAKWLPSVQTVDGDKKKYLAIILKKLGLTKAEYRRKLSTLREYLKVTERLMSAGKWDEIVYSAVPSKAGLIYRDAFLKHDEERRRKYLDDLKSGKETINSTVLFPYEVVHKYYGRTALAEELYFGLTNWNDGVIDEALEQMWKALPDYVGGNGSTLCVADGSGSMLCKIGRTKISAIEVANSLAIYFAERAGGQFKNKFITFSHNPQLVDMSKATSLAEKITIARSYDEVSDTNVEAVFDLILKTAVNCKVKDEDVPANVLILSDMEFNDCVADSSGQAVGETAPLFDVIAGKYKAAGIKMPRLIFWNLNGRTLGVPVRTNEKGLAFVSGFSPAACRMVLCSELDPFQCLLSVLNDKRYEQVDNALIG